MSNLNLDISKFADCDEKTIREIELTRYWREQTTEDLIVTARRNCTQAWRAAAELDRRCGAGTAARYGCKEVARG